MSAAEYVALGETAERYELIDGIIVMSPSASQPHSEAFAEVLFQLKIFARRMKSIRVLPELDFEVNVLTVYRPDISVYLASRLSNAQAARVERGTLAPDLIVEVLSPSTRALDLTTKRDDYGRAGVDEYWLVDPLTAVVRAFRQQGGVLAEATLVADALTLESSALSGFSLDLVLLREILAE